MEIRRTTGSGGFTLIELLVVILILGVLAGGVTLAVGRQHQQVLVAVCRAERTTVMKAIEAARLINDRQEYPGVAGPDGLDGVRATGTLQWGPPSEYWRYVTPASPDGLDPSDVERHNESKVSSSDCDHN